VSRNPAPSREKGQRVAASVAQCFAGSRQSDVAATLETTAHDYSRADGFNMVAQVFKVRGGVEREDGSRGSTNLGKQAGKGPLISEEKSLTLATSNDQVLAFDTRQITSPLNYSSQKPGDPCHPLAAGAHIPAVAQSVTTHPTVTTCTGVRQGCSTEAMSSLSAMSNAGAFPTIAVRRLTPVECERLQGFPDNFTRIPWKKKPAEDCPDGPRYKALGNSMAVPCMRWIGERIGRQAC
jgi:DNA (cytosine-5)-methyltransferase 1